ncbi:A24 family peptidase [Oscillibacter sp.]|uniref:prepilin peptidase n=1 Tax=Oscillibacter sp. TaxID=1945593 RepID=UPI00262A84CB|nr:A24 family peptidase [Oscillibacter sp.]MDD3347408.1 prepilin peptidase [Oscillibacter sp.]
MDSVTILNYIFVFLFGITVGSFLNVCILRIPAGESIVTGPSHCTTCGKRLKWWELIPLFSYLALRGRCSACHSPISVQYPLIEAANGALWLLAYHRFGFSPDTLLGCFFASALLVASIIDARTREIPPGTTITVAVLGALRLLLPGGDWPSHLLGLVSVSGALLLIFILSGGAAIGGGDIKLMAGCGLFLGLRLNLLAFFLGCVLGSVIHLTRMCFGGAKRDLALGPYLAAGAMLSFLWGDAFLGWYLSLLFS